MARITMALGNTQMLRKKFYPVASKWNPFEEYGSTFTHIKMPGDKETALEREIEAAFRDELNRVGDDIADLWLITESQRNGVIVYTGTLMEKNICLTASPLDDEM